MRTFQKVRGTPVFSLENGRRIGQVSDIFVNSDGAVAGFWVTSRRWWSRRRFLALSAIDRKDMSGFFVKKEGDLTSSDGEDHRFHDGRNHLFGKLLAIDDGSVAGLLEDVYFLDESGTIVGYEVTCGFFSDLSEGRHVFKTSVPLKVEKDRLVLRTYR
ncbi:hypothetical protein CR205_09505 [Alteribacter lacisalsi]|uniref:PRC-barrel domain-containing protein n=1 Tax=Alteribacter lacisalsi TaxID=2045244 RepID=A0A2W0HYA9_9BACI|nr:PRC-barrel domain-containing protein [Alteribacter lacisalsi]PYZ98788.1 hypothetical protein CR205_09505 [Alteribacter lacisalsi]